MLLTRYNDFRKIASIESYTPTDNASELTARINHDGWETSYRNWLQGSRLRPTDAVFVFSVGGGDAQLGISANLVSALQYAKQVGARICGIVGRDGGFTAQVSDACVLIPVINPRSGTCRRLYLASARFPPQAQGRGDEMGIHRLRHRAVTGLNQVFPLLWLSHENASARIITARELVPPGCISSW